MYLGHNYDAEARWKKALAVFEAEGDESGQLKAIGNLGALRSLQGRHAEALENNFAALNLAEELDDERSVMINLGNIDSAYNYLDEQGKALDYDRKALAAAYAQRDTELIAMYNGNIGNIYYDGSAWDSALQYQLLSLRYNRGLGNVQGIGRDLINVGQTYLGRGEYERALSLLMKSLDIGKRNSLMVVEAKAQSVIANMLLKSLQDSSSIARLLAEMLRKYGIPSARAALLGYTIGLHKEGIALNTELADLQALAFDYRGLSQAQRLAGLYRDALESEGQYIRYNDSVFSLESKAKIATLETKRELQLKDKQIELDRLAVAKKRNERVFYISAIAALLVIAGVVFRNIRLKNAKQLSENRLQTFQARMNPHFIFNSLNSIQSLVLAGETIPSITYLSRFAKLMRQILDGSAQSRVMLQKEVEMLRGYIELEQLRFDKFSYDIRIAPDINPEAIEIPAMVIQPFIENAIIHGLLPRGDGGMLTISFARVGAAIHCTVDDNGIGRKASAAFNAARRKDHTSHGISIATARLALLGKSAKSSGGAVVYIDKEDAGVPRGTTVELTIPTL